MLSGPIDQSSRALRLQKIRSHGAKLDKIGDWTDAALLEKLESKRHQTGVKICLKMKHGAPGIHFYTLNKPTLDRGV